MVFGDLNAVNEEEDRAQSTSKERIDRAMADFIVAMDLSDVWRVLKGLEQGHTFHRPRDSSRIDRFLSTKEITQNFKQIKTIPVPFSDHFALVCVFKVIISNQQASRPLR